MSKFEETGDMNLGINLINYHSSRGRGMSSNSNFAKMSNLRVIQKHLVYVIGLSANLAFKDSILSRFEYFGQYGRIVKLVVNKNKVYNMNGPNGPSYSAYITYSTPEECSLAILALDNSIVDNHLLRASYGTTKYCANFLRGVECFNRECLYLHFMADDDEIIDRDDMNTNKAIFLSQHILAMKIADIFSPDKKQKFMYTKNNKVFFPAPWTIYDKELVIEQFKKLIGETENPASNWDVANSNLDLSNSRNSEKKFYFSRNQLYRAKERSRFSFANANNAGINFNSINTSNFNSQQFNSPSKMISRILQDESIEIPSFVSYIISKKCSRYSFFKKFYNTNDEMIYFDNSFIREYNDHNPWARFIAGSIKNKTIKIGIEKLAEKEQLRILKKFNSA